jgi:tRNA-dihydrouridine synthase B
MLQTERFFAKQPLLLAPMEGITTPAFRRAIANIGGIDMLCTEFIRLTHSFNHKKAIVKHYDKIPGIPLSVQLMGDEPGYFYQHVPTLIEAGADVIDLNLGCPSRTVNKKGCGVAMLLDLHLLGEVVRSIRKVCSVPFSAKIRAGYYHESEATAVCKILVEEGIDFITVHPRVRDITNARAANWDIIRALKASFKVPIIGNGDVFQPADSGKMRQQTKCDGVMIGRAAIGNPFIFMQISDFHSGGRRFEPSGKDFVRFFINLLNSYINEFQLPETRAINRIKELLRWHKKWLKSPQIVNTILQETEIDAFSGLLEANLSRLGKSDYGYLYPTE